MKKFFPFLTWLKGYNLGCLKADLLAGLSVGLVLIPQSMANAQLAGLPAHYGLYASFLPTIVSALFSSSKNMCTGMVGIVAMMTAAALSPMAAAGSSGYIAYAVALSFMVGCIQIGLRLLRLSYLVNFLSQPVIAGFTNASLILIALSQLSKLFGVVVEPGGSYVETLYRVVLAAASGTHLPTLLMALLAWAIIFGLPRVAPKLPAILSAVLVTTFLSWATGYEEKLTLPAGQLRGAQFAELRGEFEQDNVKLRTLQNERGLVHRQLQATGRQEPEGRLDLQYTQDYLDAQITRLQRQLSLTRSGLRELSFRKLHADAEEGSFTEDASGSWRVQIAAGTDELSLVTVSRGGTVVGHIPPGLPAFGLPAFDGSSYLELLPFALAIAFIGLANGMAVAKTTARSTGDHVEAKQELLAQGLANIASGLSHSGPVSGSFSSSGVSARSGGKTGLTAVFAGLTPLLALLFFTPALYYLPLSVLAAIVIASMLTQVKFTVFRRGWLVHWTDGLIGLGTFAVTLAYAPRIDIGLMFGVALSMIVFLYDSMHPGIAALTFGPHRRVCDSSAFTAEQRQCEYLAVLRFQRSLTFMNSSVLEEYVLELLREKPELLHLHLVCTGINDIDASGEETLGMLVRWVRKCGLGITFNGINERVQKVLERSGLYAEIGPENIFETMREAVCTVHSALPQTNSPQHHCPWRCFCEPAPQPVTRGVACS